MTNLTETESFETSDIKSLIASINVLSKRVESLVVALESKPVEPPPRPSNRSRDKAALVPAGQPVTVDVLHSMLGAHNGCSRLAARKLGLGWPLRKGWLREFKNRLASGEKIYTRD